MHYSISAQPQIVDCIIIGLFKNPDDKQFDLLNAEQQASIQKILARQPGLTDLGKISLQYFVPGFADSAVMLYGLGTGTPIALRKALVAVGDQLTEQKFKTVQILLPKLSALSDRLLIRQAIISLEDAHIQRDQLKTTPAQKAWPDKITFWGTFKEADQALTEGQAIAAGIKLTKNLANLPANHCTPTILAEQAVQLTRDQPKLSVDIYDEQAIKELKMGCLQAVAQGSIQPPRLIVVHYRGADTHAAPTVLLGKGITFDSGGICLKPAAHMDEMKYDMSGAAAVLGTLHTANVLQLPINLIGVIVSAENLPSGSAVKPGDVVTSLSGKTVEILNTDAEGRLILCDGLTFIERFAPKAVIDVATLTGAIIITLGAEASGLMSNNQALADQVLAASTESGDRVWQLPLWEEYQTLINSAFADIANMGTDQAKSIAAGCFLARFAEKYPWVHLDIAGTAWTGGGNMNRAATGRPVSLLMHYLLEQC